MKRRRLLKLLGGGAGALASAVAVDNVFLGYEALGTNLQKQDLGAMVRETFFFGPRPSVANGVPVELEGEWLRIGPDDPDAYRYPNLTDDDAAAVDSRYGLGGLVAEGVPTVADLRTSVRFEFHDPRSFFERVRSGDSDAAAVELLRGVGGVDPSLLRTFADAAPDRPEAVVDGLVDGFRERASYDYERYAAGAVTYNLLFGVTDLRDSMAHPVGFEALLESEGSVGLFCDEFTRRAAEALHAVPAADQRAPVFAGAVVDVRHRHVFSTVGSVLREDGDVVVPVTFLDFTHSTMYDDLQARGLLGEGLDAYDRRHRADVIYWHDGI